jgi:ABC-type transport system involved in multi-copper enzyme maturation permease subunit
METEEREKRKRFREPNPMLIKELRRRMRGARAFVVLTIYLLLLSCLSSVIYYAYNATNTMPGTIPNFSELGTVLFAAVVLIELFMVTFITPAFTSGAITGERDRKTYELLRATLLPAEKLVNGKLTSALTYVGLLILAAVPLESLALMLGGVVLEELILALVILATTAFAFAVIGLFFSTVLRTTLAATVLSYGTALIATIGLPLILLFAFALLVEPVIFGYSSTPTSLLLRTTLFYVVYFLANLSPIVSAVLTKLILLEESTAWLFWMDMSSGYAYTTLTPVSTHTIPIPSGWIIYTLVYLSLSLILLIVTKRIVRRQETK